MVTAVIPQRKDEPGAGRCGGPHQAGMERSSGRHQPRAAVSGQVAGLGRALCWRRRVGGSSRLVSRQCLPPRPVTVSLSPWGVLSLVPRIPESPESWRGCRLNTRQGKNEQRAGFLNDDEAVLLQADWVQEEGTQGTTWEGRPSRGPGAPGGWGPRALRTLGGLHCLLHGAPLVRDLAAVTALRLPLAARQGQVAAGRVLAVAQFGGLGGLQVPSDGAAICLSGHGHATRVEVADETHHGGLVGIELLRGGREQGD